MPDNSQTVALKSWANDPATSTYVRLAKAPVVAEGGAITLADLVEADFPGYSPQKAVEFEGVLPQEEEVGEVVSKPVHFEASDAIVEPQQIHAEYAVRWQDGDYVLMKAAVIDPPVIFAKPGDSHTTAVRMQGFGFGV